jgi:hypothetical protein
MNQQSTHQQQQQHRDREAEMNAAFHEYAMEEYAKAAARTKTKPTEIIAKTSRKVRVAQGEKICELIFSGKYQNISKHDMISVLAYLQHKCPSTELWNLHLEWVNDEHTGKSYCDAIEVMPLIRVRYRLVREGLLKQAAPKPAVAPSKPPVIIPVKPKAPAVPSRVLSLLKSLPQTTLMEVLARDRGMSVGDLYAEIIGAYVEKIAGEA